LRLQNVLDDETWEFVDRVDLQPKSWQRFSQGGTPAYMAPEVILSGSYSLQVDWWSLGILTFELLAGVTPFESDSRDDTFKRILSGQIPYWPTGISTDAKDFILSLLRPSPHDRPSSEQIKAHSFFKNIDWKMLERGKCKAKNQPLFTRVDDLRYFEARNSALNFNQSWNLYHGDNMLNLEIRDHKSKAAQTLKNASTTLVNHQLSYSESHYYVDQDFFITHVENMCQPSVLAKVEFV
jgi:serine/threonine protein kinase